MFLIYSMRNLFRSSLEAPIPELVLQRQTDIGRKLLNYSVFASLIPAVLKYFLHFICHVY